MDKGDSFNVLEDQIRECFGRVVYTHKAHEKMADMCGDRLSKCAGLQIFITALTSSGAVGVVVFEEWWLKIATAVISFVGLFLSTYMKNFDPGGVAQKHRDAAAKIWSVRESYFSLLSDMRDLPLSDVRVKRDELQNQLAAIYEGAPQTNGKAYKLAQNALKLNEELTFSVEEIDCFLPAPLKKAKPQGKS